MKTTYEDIQFLVLVMKKLDDEEAATLLSIIIQIIEAKSPICKECL